MAHTPPRRLTKVSRAFTSILTAGALVAGGLTYTAIEAPAPAAAEPCIPGSSPTCPPGPGPGPTTDVPTGPATTAPQAPTTTPPGAQQPTEAPSDPTPNQGGNGMNVQTPNQPTTNPNGIFGTPTPTATQQPTVSPQPTQTGGNSAPATPQTTSAQQQTNLDEPVDRPQSNPNREATNERQCTVPSLSAVRDGKIAYNAAPELASAMQRAAANWNGSATSISPARPGETPTLNVTSVSDPGGNYSARYSPGINGGPATIAVNPAHTGGISADALQSLLTHELGHAQGLRHAASSNSIMTEGPLPKVPSPSDIRNAGMGPNCDSVDQVQDLGACDVVKCKQFVVNVSPENTEKIFDETQRLSYYSGSAACGILGLRGGAVGSIIGIAGCSYLIEAAYDNMAHYYKGAGQGMRIYFTYSVLGVSFDHGEFIYPGEAVPAPR